MFKQGIAFERAGLDAKLDILRETAGPALENAVNLENDRVFGGGERSVTCSWSFDHFIATIGDEIGRRRSRSVDRASNPTDGSTTPGCLAPVNPRVHAACSRVPLDRIPHPTRPPFDGSADRRPRHFRAPSIARAKSCHPSVASPTRGYGSGISPDGRRRPHRTAPRA